MASPAGAGPGGQLTSCQDRQGSRDQRFVRFVRAELDGPGGGGRKWQVCAAHGTPAIRTAEPSDYGRIVAGSRWAGHRAGWVPRFTCSLTGAGRPLTRILSPGQHGGVCPLFISLLEQESPIRCRASAAKPRSDRSQGTGKASSVISSAWPRASARACNPVSGSRSPSRNASATAAVTRTPKELAASRPVSRLSAARTHRPRESPAAARPPALAGPRARQRGTSPAVRLPARRPSGQGRRPTRRTGR